MDDVRANAMNISYSSQGEMFVIFFSSSPYHTILSSDVWLYACRALVNHPSYEFRINFPFTMSKQSIMHKPKWILTAATVMTTPAMTMTATKTTTTTKPTTAEVEVAAETRLHTNIQMQILPFCLSKYLHKSYTGLYFDMRN